MKDHEIAKVVNELRDIATQYHDTQQLRERIASIVVPILKQPDNPDRHVALTDILTELRQKIAATPSRQFESAPHVLTSWLDQGSVLDLMDAAIEKGQSDHSGDRGEFEVLGHMSINGIERCKANRGGAINSRKTRECDVPVFIRSAQAAPALRDGDERASAKRLIDRHVNAARALEHMYTEKNIARLKAVGEELEAALASNKAAAVAVGEPIYQVLDVPGKWFDVREQDFANYFEGRERRVVYATPPAPIASEAQPIAWTADQLYDAIEETLLHHRMSNLEGDDGEAFPLVDHLTTPGDRGIDSGKLEIRLICDAIYNEVLTKAIHPAAAHPARAEVLEEACAAIKAEDDRQADNDYMLDSDDCIRVIRELKEKP